MKYLDEYRDGGVARKIVEEIRRVQTNPWVIMEVCGGQTHSIVKNGIDYLAARGHGVGAWSGLPRLRDSLEMIDKAHAIARHARRDFLLLRRHAARSRLRWRSVHDQVRRRRCPRRLFAARLSADRTVEPDKRSYFSPLALRRPRPPTPCWLAREAGARARTYPC